MPLAFDDKLERRSKKTRMMLEHYGDGFTVCPLDGCRAPEMATGKFDEVLKDIWDFRQSELINKAAELNVALDSASWDTVSNDFTNAETYSFMKRLPWILCALSSAGESLAPDYDSIIFNMSEIDPQESSHDPITWKWLSPESPLRADLGRFKQGQSKSSLAWISRIEIGTLKFLPVVETTIEEKHHQISVWNKAHSIGPVRVSLAIRLPEVGEHLERSQLDLMGLLDLFDETRNLKRAVGLVNFTGHPKLSKLDTMKMQQVRHLMGKAFYRYDIDGIFQKTTVTKKHDARMKEKQRALHSKLAGLLRKSLYHMPK